MRFPKDNTWRDEKYLAIVRSLKCVHCGDDRREYIHAHHIKGVGGFSGTGIKAPDWATMPLCSRCHHDMHLKPSMWQDQWEMIARTLGEAIERGFITIGGRDGR